MGNFFVDGSNFLALAIGNCIGVGRCLEVKKCPAVLQESKFIGLNAITGRPNNERDGEPNLGTLASCITF